MHSIVHKAFEEGFWETEEYYLMLLYFKADAVLLEQKKKHNYLASPQHAKLKKQNFMIYGHF